MRIGLIGAGNMARAMARGWAEPVLCHDPVAARAEALARETGGEALGSNAEVAARADLVVLCHKPAQLQAVASEVAGPLRESGGAVASILAATPLSTLREAYAGIPAYRFLPSLPVELRRGAVVHAADPHREAPHAAALADRGPATDSADVADVAGGGRGPATVPADAAGGPASLDERVLGLFGRLGMLVTLDDALVDVAMGLMSCAPAYIALVAEAQVDAGVRRGIPPRQAAELVAETLAGTAELLRSREYDTLALRREVTSPGGTTARGLDALERGGIRAAFSDALDAVLAP